jgi:hypothetical protein
MAIRTWLGFLTMLPSSTLHFGAKRLRMKILPIAIRANEQSVQIVTLRNRTPNPIAKLFVDELNSVAEPQKAKKRPPATRRQPKS